jgi:hypothetical protein
MFEATEPYDVEEGSPHSDEPYILPHVFPLICIKRLNWSIQPKISKLAVILSKHVMQLSTNISEVIEIISTNKIRKHLHSTIKASHFSTGIQDKSKAIKYRNIPPVLEKFSLHKNNNTSKQVVIFIVVQMLSNFNDIMQHHWRSWVINF